MLITQKVNIQTTSIGCHRNGVSSRRDCTSLSQFFSFAVHGWDDKRSVFSDAVTIKQGFIKKCSYSDTKLPSGYNFKKRYCWLNIEKFLYAKSNDSQVSKRETWMVEFPDGKIKTNDSSQKDTEFNSQGKIGHSAMLAYPSCNQSLDYQGYECNRTKKHVKQTTPAPS